MRGMQRALFHGRDAGANAVNGAFDKIFCNIAEVFFCGFIEAAVIFKRNQSEIARIGAEVHAERTVNNRDVVWHLRGAADVNYIVSPRAQRNGYAE